MKTYLFFLIPAFLYISCNEEKKEDKTIPEENKSQKTDGKTESEEIICKSLPENHFAFPATFAIMGNNSNPVLELELKLNSEDILEGKFTRDSSEYIFTIDPSALIANISGSLTSSEFHQKISVYQFEKQWHFDTVKLAPEINLRLINPASGISWYAEIFETPKQQARLASFHITLPESVYQKIFTKINPGKNKNIANYIYVAPDLEKIDYNKLRRMGKFYEGFAGATGNMKLNEDKFEKNTHIRKLNNFKTYQDYFENDFNVSATDLNGFDSTEKEVQSVKDFYNVKSFIYKTTYSLNTVSKDSLLEIQFDFKDKNNTPTQRLVIGGTPFSSMMKLNLNDYAKAPLIPVGFSVDPEMPDQFCLISNMSGYWSDTGLGRNISGVKIYWDKLNKSKLHIWLIGSDGITPLMHYISILDKLFVK